MSIVRIVLTGGPCAGKTSGLSRIESELSDRGYKVFVVAETATELLLGGINPVELPLLDFQKAIFDVQSSKERVYLEIAKLYNKDVIILLDRGLLDAKSFMTKKETKELFNLFKKQEIEVRDSYDAIFHLKTTADGAEEFFGNKTNKVRRENLQEARDVDKRNIAAWTGHPHLRIIDNSTDFKGKLDRLMKEIYSFLGQPVPVEIERKYLIKMPDIDNLKSKYNVSKSDIIQTYLKSDDESEKRIRQRGLDGVYSYYYTEKSFMSDISRLEKEKKITSVEYLRLMMDLDIKLKQIRKVRYCFVYENSYIELDIYEFWKDYAIVEVELTSESDEVKLPPELEVIKEVTSDNRFKNRSLAENTNIL